MSAVIKNVDTMKRVNASKILKGASDIPHNLLLSFQDAQIVLISHGLPVRIVLVHSKTNVNGDEVALVITVLVQRNYKEQVVVLRVQANLPRIAMQWNLINPLQVFQTRDNQLVRILMQAHDHIDPGFLILDELKIEHLAFVR